MAPPQFTDTADHDASGIIWASVRFSARADHVQGKEHLAVRVSPAEPGALYAHHTGPPELDGCLRDQVDTQGRAENPRGRSIDRPTRCDRGSSTSRQRGAGGIPKREGNGYSLISIARASLPSSGRVTEARGDWTAMTSLLSKQDEFRGQLIAEGLLLPAGVPGLYARGAGFEFVLDAVDAAVTRAGDDARALTPGGGGYQLYRFPPVFAREIYEKTDYIESFPDLTGVVNTFSGTSADHRELLADRAAGRAWDHHLSPGDTVMVSSACHPLYGALPSVLPEGGVAAEVNGYCFRHEPSPDPMRMQTFRMHEYVRVGTPADAAQFRTAWVSRSIKTLSGFGLAVRAVAANDPFFGRSGRLLANEQLANDLKTEIVAHVYGEENPADAIASCNLAEDHFGRNFGLTLQDGSTAHTACVGFGLERITLALFAVHGFEPLEWPEDVRRSLFR